MYDGIKQALGPMQKKTAPLSITGKIIQDQAKQMEQWVELYSRENMVSEEALDAIECWMSWIGNPP